MDLCMIIVVLYVQQRKVYKLLFFYAFMMNFNKEIKGIRGISDRYLKNSYK